MWLKYFTQPERDAHDECIADIRKMHGPASSDTGPSKVVKPFSQAEMEALARGTKHGSPTEDDSFLGDLGLFLLLLLVPGLPSASIALLLYGIVSMSLPITLFSLLSLPVTAFGGRALVLAACSPDKKASKTPAKAAPKALPKSNKFAVEAARDWLTQAQADAKVGGIATTISAQLDLLDKLMLGQEETAAHKAAANLLETDLPKLVEFYLNVPEQLRESDYLGQTPDAMLAAGLHQISAKAGEAINQLKQAPLDDLTIHGRFLESKHGNADAIAD